jgi:hypothetical protein
VLVDDRVQEPEHTLPGRNALRVQERDDRAKDRRRARGPGDTGARLALVEDDCVGGWGGG